MCGRIANTLPADAMARLFGARPANDLPTVPNYNVCPTARVHAIRFAAGERELVAMRWGLIPHWAKSERDGPLLINARAETVSEKPAFRSAYRERRCLVPATGFYEWTKGEDGKRLPWLFARRDGDPIVFGAIWQDWNRGDDGTIRTCAIVTTAANDRVAEIHHRMPLIVERGDWALWLGESANGANGADGAPDGPDGMLVPGAEDVLDWHRVSTAVNSSRASGPILVEPLADSA